MSEEFEQNVLRFAKFIEEQHGAIEIMVLPNDDGSFELTYKDPKAYLLLRMEEDAATPSRIRLVIDIHKRTVKLLRRAEIMQWVEDCQIWLEKFHLKEFSLTGRAAFLNVIDNLCKTRMTASEVAAYLNAWISNLLIHHEQIQVLRKASPLSDEQTWQVLIEQGYNTIAKVHAYQILDWMNLRKESRELIEYGLENVREGRSFVFGKDQPIDRQRVLNCVKAWRKETE